MYKLITIDVDDTLLNDDWKVTEATKESLKQAIEQGVTVTLATGRMYASAKQIAAQIDLNVPLITYQGSLVKNLLDGEVLYERSVPPAIARFLYEYAEKHNLHLQGYYDDKLVGLEDNDKIKEYSHMAKVPYIIEPVEEILTKPLTKLLFFEDPDVLDTHAEQLKQMIGQEVHITKSKPYFLEVLHKEGTKGDAVRFLAQHVGCDLSEVIAIGDSWNDHEMLEVAGLGVAMGNAVESLKQIANFITKTNNEDGVKYVIDRFILKQE
ncbi:Cof-type HAD-IIB family hydrolase [Ammoniphilus sp. CFH 90114]|uniref:Cof-type HAD-IIB family hydrolase n=1 Tax=Ammoniphilus sp. CFH 90114 TaxID=2493665 RepID=UPI00100FDD0C|nr:Cof-type HAD-IIB family hydrolase [Ammoniphilus sp. CFH 90114]RXT14678.1 HAD family phosphatase [Ammoniphilus sp. CFH 90114]